MVIVTDFLTGVLSAIIIWAALKRFFEPSAEQSTSGALAAQGD